MSTTEAAPVTLWDKIEGCIENDVKWAEVEFTDAEKEVVTLAAPLFGAAEATAITDLKAGVTSFLTTIENPKNWALTDIETAFMNSLKTAESALVPVAEGLGSQLVQATIALIIHAL